MIERVNMILTNVPLSNYPIPFIFRIESYLLINRNFPPLWSKQFTCPVDSLSFYFNERPRKAENGVIKPFSTGLNMHLAENALQ